MPEVQIPYLRRVMVRIGPIEEWRGGGNEKLALTFHGDGGIDNFRIQFDIHKHAMSTATPSVIMITNLSQGLRNALRQGGIQVAVYVGWSNTDMVLLHTGSLLAAISRRNGPDIVTELYSNPAYGGIHRQPITLNFSGGQSIKELVAFMAARIPGVDVDPKNILISPEKATGTQGLSFQGELNDGLNKLAREYSFSWNIENKVFRAFDHERYFTGSDIPLISSTTGLVRVDPMLASPQQLVRGVSIQSMLNPYVQPGHLIRLQSDLNPDLSGQYAVHMLSHSGDTHGMTWDSNIVSFVTR